MIETGHTHELTGQAGRGETGRGHTSNARQAI